MTLFLKAAGKRIIVIDPKYSETAQLLADTFIPIIPGTDAAMAAAIAYTWIQDGTYAKSWVSTHVVGFDADHSANGRPGE